MNPLDLRGPEFLQFYLIFGVAVLVVAWMRRQRVLSSGDPSPARWTPGVYPREGDAYPIALLRGGEREVARTVLGRLFASGLVALDEDSLRRGLAAESPPPLEPMEEEALEAMRQAHGKRAHEAEGWVRGAIAPHLERLLLLTAAVLAGLGLAKLAVALGRGRTNVGFLILMMVLYLVVAFFLLRPPRRTRAGDQYLSWLQESHRGLVSLLTNGRRENLSELALVAGIYGLQALPVMSPLNRALRPPSDARIGGCGGGDSGGGGGCGGGGCGGGGCGGCGG